MQILREADSVAGEGFAPGEGPAQGTLVHSAVADAMETRIMRIECGFTRGFAGLTLIGNPTEVCRDGKERAKAALESLGVDIPARRLVVSMTPAEVRKDGSHLDLPVAISVYLLLAKAPPRVEPSEWLFAAELGLKGELRPVRGVVSFAVAAMAQGLKGVVVAADNLAELAVVVRESQEPLQVLTFPTLKEVLSWLVTGLGANIEVMAPKPPAREEDGPTFDDMVLSEELACIATVVAAGRHSLLLRGTPGTGKSMFAARLVSILPDLERAEHIEALRIHSAISERLKPGLLAGRPPYRAPHHQASAAALLGGAEHPGEMVLAHGGVLFLDELPEFRRDLIEGLREPLEYGEVRVARAKRKLVWKSRFILLAACNNCPCGWYGSRRRLCHCGAGRRMQYESKLSGPILDRIDLHLNTREVETSSGDLLTQLALGHGQTARLSAVVRKAREFARERNQALGVIFNRDLEPRSLAKASGHENGAFAALVNRVVPPSASRRSAVRCLRVARTLADLALSPRIELEHLSRAWSWQAEPAAAARGDLVLAGGL